jgi:hypothetical protein
MKIFQTAQDRPLRRMFPISHRFRSVASTRIGGHHPVHQCQQVHTVHTVREGQRDKKMSFLKPTRQIPISRYRVLLWVVDEEEREDEAAQDEAACRRLPRQWPTWDWAIRDDTQLPYSAGSNTVHRSSGNYPPFLDLLEAVPILPAMLRYAQRS